MSESLMTLALNLGYQVATLALVTLGLAIAFGLLGVMNMAHGEFVMLGAYCAVLVQRAGWPDVMAVPAAVVLTALAGWGVERLLIRPLAQRPFDTLLATWGLSILLRKGVEAVFGRSYQSVQLAWPGTVSVAGVPYPAFRLALVVAISIGFVALALWYRRSPAGTRLQAMVANPALAESLGLDTRRMATAAFVTGSCCAGVAGALLAPLVRVEPTMGLDYLLSSFFVLVVGGLGSLGGLLVGTVAIGGTQALVAGHWDQTWGTAAVLVLAIAFLWMKPDGLVSRR